MTKYATCLSDDLTDDDIQNFVSVLHKRHVAEMSFINHYDDWVSGHQELSRRMLCLAETVDTVAGTFMNIICSAWYVAGVMITLTLGKIGIRIPVAVPVVRKVTDFAAHTAALLPYAITCIFASCYYLRFRSLTEADKKGTDLIGEDLYDLLSYYAAIKAFCDKHRMPGEQESGRRNNDVTLMTQYVFLLHFDEEISNKINMYDLVNSSVEVHIGPKIVQKPTLRDAVKKRGLDEQKIIAAFAALRGQ